MGQPKLDLTLENEDIKKAENSVKARERLVQLSEKQAKEKYPDLFKSL